MIGHITRLFGGIALACAGTLLLSSAGACAAVTPAGAPALTSPANASPVTLHWTPGTQVDDDDGGPGRGHGDRGLTQAVVRVPGPCPATLRGARIVGYYRDGAEHDFSDAVGDGTYCYTVFTTDGGSPAASPSLTVVVNAAAAAAAAAAAQIVPVPAPVPAAPAPAPPPADTLAPAAPTGVTLVVSRARAGSARGRVTVRWSLPATADLDHIQVVTNASHAPKTAIDGTVVYRGKGTSVSMTVAPGRKVFIAVYAYDTAGITSAPVQRVFQAPLPSSLRPLDGSKVTGTPLLSWKAMSGASYYNVQLFRNGKRVHVAWPGQASYRIPATMLRPGTYVWFVWPALEPKHAPPKFAARIGRGTFVYVS